MVHRSSSPISDNYGTCCIPRHLRGECPSGGRLAEMTPHLLLLLLSVLAQPGLALLPEGGQTWTCPALRPSASVHCSCDLPHTLRCDGRLAEKETLALLLRQVAGLVPGQRVALLDLSLANLTRLPGRLLQGTGVEGLVVSSGDLKEVSSRAFAGLEVRLME